MNILFVKPHLPLKVARELHRLLHLEPLELELVAGGIDKKHNIEILDLSLYKKPVNVFTKKIESFKPEIVGFTAYSNQAKNVLILAEIVKNHLPETFTIIGGIHATIEPGYFKNCKDIDIIVRGDGSTIIQDILSSLENASLPRESSSVIPVISENFDELINNPPPPLPDYSQIPNPRRDLVKPSDYYCIWTGEPGEKMKTLFPDVATVRTSTGCPHRCRFCVVHFLANGKYVQRSPEDVVDEIASLKQNHIYFVDDEMFINPKRVKRIAELLLERNIRKRYISWARSDTICTYPEIFKLWKEAGLSTLYVGLESMDAATLEDYNKGIKPNENRKAVRILDELGICLHAAFMVKPEFQEEDFIKLRKMVESIGTAEVTFTVFSPPPGTPLWEEHKSDFIVDDPYLFYDCMHTILPLKLPMKKFYKYFSLLSLFALRNNPWRRRKIKAPLKDMLRMFHAGMKYGSALKKISKDYK
jgi:radical SAM superfamily enzyme YgiQ (UPF0313 family)